MVRRIFIGMFAFLAFVFVLAFFLKGGYQAAIAAIPHYRGWHGQNILQFIGGTGPSSTGETFNLPGSPSSFATPTIGGTSSSGMNQPPPTVVRDYNQQSPADAQDQAELQRLQAQYDQLQAQAAAQNQ